MAVVFVLLLGASEWLIRAKIVPLDTGTQHARLFNESQSPNAIFGDSHMLKINGMEGFVNLARGGAGVESKVFAYYENKDPGKVVLHADANQFAALAGDAQEQDENAGVGDGTRFGLHVLSDRFQGFILAYWRRLLVDREFSLDSKIHADGAITESTVWGGAYSDSGRLRIASSTVALQRPVTPVADSAQGAAFIRVVSYLREREADLCLVVMPTPSEYHSLAEKIPAFQEARSFVRDVAASTGTTLVDLTEAEFGQDLFADEDHLNEIGGRRAGDLIAVRCFG